MEALRSPTLKKWWPSTQSLDLVEGAAQAVADALASELSRILRGEVVLRADKNCSDLDSAFSEASEFANVPTTFVVVPTKSRWSVVWTNCYLCDGYDALCHCLTLNHGLTTLHWHAHDEMTTFQPSAAFVHRSLSAGAIVERAVSCSVNDGHWSFFALGPPLVEEDLRQYEAKAKRDRLNESILLGLLARLGASPWAETFYELPGTCHVFRRGSPPASVQRRPTSAVCGS